MLRLWQPRLKCHRHMAPGLDREHDCRCEQQSPYSNMGYRRNDHREFGLNGIATPLNARKESGEAKAELRDYK